ncbi:uncharacterized protein LOC9662922 [Selaginella moellendorffii]|uniref:uncharacterized protein LOC9662922 n=1 Tax=Selaginella moellendorffii TaxID=88036 RepID=UPI000D1CA6EC|nr:uncharacterized protein LOC9662922 [Selaginella moellendorffii]|eukprot:XP_024526494.1 uncharacterized protein LOC9662922 [Selaginella moellendorffii]
MMREHLGSFTVTGAFALVLQIHRNQEQVQQHQSQSFHQNSQQSREILAARPDSGDLEALIAHIGLTSGGLAKTIELYGNYVARQIGLSKNSPVAKALAKVAMEYLNGDKSPSDGSLENIAAFLSKRLKDPSSSQMVFDELVKELDSCMISYFSFHWQHSAHLLDQVRSGQRNLRSIVMAATRKHRFQRAMQTLKAKRAFATLVETIKAMKTIKHLEARELPDCDHELGGEFKRQRRSPVLMLVGGGMGAGKSTVVKELLHATESIVRHDAVVVEADAFKEADVLYRSLSSGSGDVSMASQLVHDSSTRAASSLLVSALNEGRDVIFDGTMSWEPFVMQTIAMARDVHRRRYRLGPGYRLDENGVLVERYWEPVEAEETSIEDEFLASLEEDQELQNNSDGEQQKVVDEFLGKLCEEERPAYRIVLVGVTCDALLAVVRGIRRAIITNRFVPIPAQLRSHKMFAASLERYCDAVDNARIYSTSRMGGLPELIGVKDGPGKLKRLNEAGFETVRDLALLNPDASSVLELYRGRSSQVWEEVVMASDRRSRRDFLWDMLVHDDESEEDDFYSGSSSDYSTSSSSSSAASSADSLDEMSPRDD